MYPHHAPRDRFVGRTAERRTLTGTRQATIVGPPGVGKTRLALEHGRERAVRWLVPLADARTEQDVHDAVNRATSGSVVSGALLVLDDLDVPCDPSALFAAFGRAGADVLVTSRRPLHVSGETVVRLGPLEPDDALALLADRAGLEPTPELRAIASALDGIPLVLELAAIRIRVLGVPNVLRSLPSLLELLADNYVDRGPGHATWSDAVGRSWAACTTEEQHLLGALAVFRGPASLDALRAVAGETGILHTLHTLCDTSLVTLGEDGRFRMSAPIRAFVLDASPREAFERRHTEHTLGAAETLLAGSLDPESFDVLHTLAASAGELQAVAERSERDGDRDQALRALAALVPVALELGPLEPIVDAIDRLVTPDVAPDLRAAAHLSACRAHRRLGHAGPARTHLARAVEAVVAGSPVRVRSRIESDVAMVLVSEGQLDTARSLLERTLDVPGTDRPLCELRLGIALRELGDPLGARSRLLQASSGFRSSGARSQLVVVLAELAHCALDLDDLDAAGVWLDEADDLGSRSTRTRAAIVARRGLVAHADGRLDAAEALLTEAIDGLVCVGYNRAAAGLCGALGLVALEQGRLDAARRRIRDGRDRVWDDPRLFSLLSGWLAAVEAIAGDLVAARRARLGVGTLDPRDPSSVAAHVAAGTVDLALGDRATAERALALAELSGGGAGPHRTRSHEVRVAIRLWSWAAGAVPVEADDTLRVDPDGHAFARPHADPVGCERWESLRRILARLAEACVVCPGEPVPWRDLFQAGWPGQNILDSAARNRLKVAVTTLRKLGLGTHLRNVDGGYRLDDVRIVPIGALSSPRHGSSSREPPPVLRPHLRP